MSKIEVNQVDTQCGSTLTLGSSGKTVTLATGASQSGFGRTGTVDWCTTAKTSPLTVVSGNGYFINTTGGTITVTLPSSPSAGDIVAFKDYANTWDTNNVAVCRNGSKINGQCSNASLSTESQSVTLIYVDGTKGWQDIHDSTANITGAPNFVAATGGTVLTCGDFKTHVFTGSGCFAVTSIGKPAGSTTLDYIVVAGGGGGSLSGPEGGGAGAGGFRSSNGYSLPAPETSPLASPTGITAALQTYPITVGGGGARRLSPAGCGAGCQGSTSIFSTISSAGGGGGGQYPGIAGGTGGSGGGGGTNCAAGGAGNTPPTNPAQGQPGGSGSGAIGPGSNPVHRAGGGGGGAGASGGGGGPGGGGAGGTGSYLSNTFFGPTAPSYGETGPVTPTRYFAGGGGGGATGSTPNKFGVGGSGGGGNGGQAGPAPVVNSENGTVNTGGGAGGVASSPNCIGAGGSGFVAIRYKFQ